MRNQQIPVSQYPLQTLIEDATVFLGRDYSKGYARCIELIWLAFLHYADDTLSGSMFSTDLVQRFLADQCEFPSKSQEELAPVSGDIQQHLRAMQMLTDFVIHGRWVHGSRAHVPLTLENQRVLEAFTADWYRAGLSARALRPCLIRLRQFFLYLQANDLAYTQINPAAISEFVTTQLGFRQRTVEMITYYLRKLFRFLYLNNYLSTDWSDDVPKVRVVPNKRIPSTWRREEVERLLAMVDR